MALPPNIMTANISGYTVAREHLLTLDVPKLKQGCSLVFSFTLLYVYVLVALENDSFSFDVRRYIPADQQPESASENKSIVSV